MSNNNIIGERIKELREQAGEKQEELGETTFYDRRCISYYERGLRMPKADTIAAIAKHYNVSADYLLGLTNTAWKIRGGIGMNNDLISRQAAIEAIDAAFPVDPMMSKYAQGRNFGAALAKIYVELLPSVQLERNKGKWIVDVLADNIYRCSECGVDAPVEPAGGTEYKSNYCPYCGAKMEGETE